MSVALSIVVHGHRQYVVELLEDLAGNVHSVTELWLTANTIDDAEFLTKLQHSYDFNLIVNSAPKGFGANHNSAFLRTSAEYFVICNPDIRFSCDPFPQLIESLKLDARLQVVSPTVVSPVGIEEDHARDFMFPNGLIRRLLSRRQEQAAFLNMEDKASKIFQPDWLGGMLHLYRSRDFQLIGGFDEGYFLYVEDMDLCWRFRQAGGVCRVIRTAPSVIHAAQRMSRRSGRHIRWHIAGLLRFWMRVAFRSVRLPDLKVHTVLAENVEQTAEASGVTELSIAELNENGGNNFRT
jgi:N-acetylglucosaminyl-diphospho-decaprenol L-rhamnosyltransferase